MINLNEINWCQNPKVLEVNLKLKGKFSETNEIIQFKQIKSTCLHKRFNFQIGVMILKYKFGAKNSHRIDQSKQIAQQNFVFML